LTLDCASPPLSPAFDWEEGSDIGASLGDSVSTVGRILGEE